MTEPAAASELTTLTIGVVGGTGPQGTVSRYALFLGTGYKRPIRPASQRDCWASICSTASTVRLISSAVSGMRDSRRR